MYGSSGNHFLDGWIFSFHNLVFEPNFSSSTNKFFYFREVIIRFLTYLNMARNEELYGCIFICLAHV